MLISLSSFLRIDTAQIEFSLNTYQSKSAILGAIDAMQPLSGTGRNVAAAELQLPTVFPLGTTITRSGAITLAVIFFDAASDSKSEAIQQAQSLTNRGIYALCVGLTSQVDMDELQRVSTSPLDNSVNVFTVSSYDMLSSQVNAFETFLCTNRKPSRFIHSVINTFTNFHSVIKFNHTHSFSHSLTHSLV